MSSSLPSAWIQTMGLNGVTIRQIFDHVMLRFANVSQLKVNSNLIRFNAPTDPSVTLAVYLRLQARTLPGGGVQHGGVHQRGHYGLNLS